MANIRNQQPKAPIWPWGGRKSVRERLVDPAQLKSKKVGKKGDPRNPALASTALIDFITGGHVADELRLPAPPMPDSLQGLDSGFMDRPHLDSASERSSERSAGQTSLMQLIDEAGLANDKRDRLKSLLSREAEMAKVLGKVAQAVKYIEKMRRLEQKEEGY